MLQASGSRNCGLFGVNSCSQVSAGKIGYRLFPFVDVIKHFLVAATSFLEMLLIIACFVSTLIDFSSFSFFFGPTVCSTRETGVR